jgi:hypothetical protein
MLDKMEHEIDAVVVSTPDHTHAIAAVTAMRMGKHVYCEKPLTHSIYEARLLRDTARKYKVATQMGNQGYSHEATRVACEIIWSGEIGEVKEVHAWMGRTSWPQGMTKTPPPTPVPSTLDWDLWLGTAAARPFTAGDQEYQNFVIARSGRGGRAGGVGVAPPTDAAAGAQGARARGGGGIGGEDFGFYLRWSGCNLSYCSLDVQELGCFS